GDRAFYDKYPMQKRWDALQALCELPAKLKLSVVMHAVTRAEIKTLRPELNNEEVLGLSICCASGGCAVGMDRHLRAHADENEVAIIVHEDNSRTNLRLRNFHQELRSPDMASRLLARNDPK